MPSWSKKRAELEEPALVREEELFVEEDYFREFY